MLLLMMINILIIIMMLIIMTFMSSFKKMISRVNMSPYECGFDPKSSARIPFLIQFFLIFIIFNMEIIILLPLIKLISNNYLNCMLMAISFLMILIIGFYYEWLQNVLKWTI